MSWLPDWIVPAAGYGALVVGLVMLSALIAALVDHLLVRPRVNDLEAEVGRLSHRLAKSESQISLLMERHHVRQDEGRGSRGRLPDAGYATMDSIPHTDLPPRTAAPPDLQARSVLLSAAELAEEAARALATQDAFREFVRRRGGQGYSLKGGADSVEPVADPDGALAADLWVIEELGARLVFPGWNLLRSQSSLLADAGRVARERLGWLYAFETGEAMRALVPAKISAGNWTVIQAGVLVLPL